MPRKASEKCRLCAKRSAVEAHHKECWVETVCHSRRSYYRNRDRYKKTKKKQYVIKTGKELPVVEIAVPETPSAIVHLYREHVDAPLHALYVELWVGGKKKAMSQAVHCFGWTDSVVREHCQSVLQAFSEQFEGIVVDRLETMVEHHPQQCPVRPCPLHSG